jgi:alkylation response protein AidB-like acyl-CoA dehydrogenase
VSQAFPDGDDYVAMFKMGVPAQATVLVSGEEMQTRRPSLLARTRLGASAELLGVVTRLLTDAVKYAKQRRRFRAALASYQSLQHLMSWATTERQQLISLYDIAVASAAVRPPDPRLARAVKAMAGRTLHTVVQTAIQVTGGVSFTWEYPQHRQHRRGLALDQFAGSSADLIAALGSWTRIEESVPDVINLPDLAGQFVP